jgi:hypothetical protein
MFSSLKIKWKLSILYTITTMALIFLISIGIYYFSYYIFIRGESRIFNARVNLFLNQKNVFIFSSTPPPPPRLNPPLKITKYAIIAATIIRNNHFLLAATA